MLMCALVGTALVTPLRADEEDSTTATDTMDNPYQAIVDRNVFGLRPPPPPPTNEPVKPPPSKLTLTGITTLLGRKLAFMETPPSAPKPGESPKGKNYFMMTEGQSEGDLEVLQIDERSGTVKVKYAGTVSTLDFTNNGAKAIASAPMPVPMPGGAPGAPGGIPAPPSLTPGGATPGTVPMPSRTLRLPTPTPTGMQSTASRGGYSYNQANPNLTVNTAGGQVALPLGASPTSNQAGVQQDPVRNMPAEHQFLMVEAERERTRNQVAAGLLPPLPPTPLTPPGSAGSVTGPAQQDVVKRRPQMPVLPGMPQPLPQ